MTFSTVINCIDGRAQLPVNKYLKEKYKVEYIDTITEAGANGLLATQSDKNIINNIFKKVDISIYRHGSESVAVAGHHDCAGNPVSEEQHKSDIRKAVRVITEKYPEMDVIGLWVDENWEVNEV